MSSYIILDLEWNQSSGGKEYSNEDLPFEIIEIGAVKLNEKLEYISKYHKLISPQVYEQLHYKISEVTHLNMHKLQKEGEPFKEVITDFLKWCGNDCIYCTWGSQDLTELERNMDYYGIKIPFKKPLFYYDVQKLYALALKDRKHTVSLDKAVEDQGITEDRPFHRADDDAFYTGKILQNLDLPDWDKYISVDYYRLPENREEEIYLEFPTYSKYVSRTFGSKQKALKDRNVTDMICADCHRLLHKKIHWFSVNQKQYFCLAYCPDHGPVRGKIRMRHTDDGKIYVVKTIKAIDNDEAEYLMKKRSEHQKKTREKEKMKRKKDKALSS